MSCRPGTDFRCADKVALVSLDELNVSVEDEGSSEMLATFLPWMAEWVASEGALEEGQSQGGGGCVQLGPAACEDPLRLPGDMSGTGDVCFWTQQRGLG